MPKTSERTTVATIALDDIVGLAEIAERCNTSPRAVWNWTRRYSFPEPFTRISNTPLWDWNTVKEWHDNWEPSKGGWHTHKARREEAAKPRRPRRQFLEGDPE